MNFSIYLVIILIWPLSFLFATQSQSPMFVFNTNSIEPKKGVWFWDQSPNNVKILKAKVKFKVPEGVQPEWITTTSSSAQLEIQDGIVELTTSALLTQIDISPPNQKPTMIIAEINSHQWPQIIKGCSNLNIKFDGLETISFFFASFCTLVNNQVQLQLSLPEEVEIINSNLYDIDGKGEVWKIYQLGDIKKAQGTIAHMSLKIGKSIFPINIQSTFKKKEENTKKIEQHFIVGLGYTQLVNKSPDNEAKDSTPEFNFKINPMTILWRFGGGFDLFSSFPTHKSNQTITSLKVSPYGFLRLIRAKSFATDITLHYSVSSQTQTSTQFGFQLNQIGAGIKLLWQQNQKWHFQFEYVTEALNSQTIKSHKWFDLLIYQKKIESDPLKLNLGYGFGIKNQTILVFDTNNTLTDFKQMSAYGLILF